jgi:hypothetical protein
MHRIVMDLLLFFYGYSQLWAARYCRQIKKTIFARNRSWIGKSFLLSNIPSSKDLSHASAWFFYVLME